MIEPDIELTTSVRADEITFGTEPQTEVGFHGSPGRESVSAAERTNLPDRVEAGVRYDDARVDYRLASRLRRRDENEDENETGPREGRRRG